MIKKILLITSILTAVSFSKNLTLTPNFEVGARIASKINPQGNANEKELVPCIGLSLDLKSKVNKNKIFDKMDIELGAGLAQNVEVHEKRIPYGQTFAYGLTEFNYEVKPNINVYSQVRLGLGTEYSSSKVNLAIMGDLGLGLEYRNFRVGTTIGARGPISINNSHEYEKPNFSAGVKVGYDIPVIR